MNRLTTAAEMEQQRIIDNLNDIIHDCQFLINSINEGCFEIDSDGGTSNLQSISCMVVDTRKLATAVEYSATLRRIPWQLSHEW